MIKTQTTPKFVSHEPHNQWVISPIKLYINIINGILIALIKVTTHYLLINGIYKAYNSPLILTSLLIHPNFQLPAHPTTPKLTAKTLNSPIRGLDSSTAQLADPWVGSLLSLIFKGIILGAQLFFSSFGFWGGSWWLNQGWSDSVGYFTRNISQKTSRWNNRFPKHL